MKNKHITVMPIEAWQEVKIESNAIYFDVTLGTAGHTLSLLEKIKQTNVESVDIVVSDLDPEAFWHLQEGLKEKGYEYKISLTTKYKIVEISTLVNVRLIFFLANFVNIFTLFSENFPNESDKKILGVLADLGLSQNQLDLSGKGFSFKRDEPLDMRLDSHLQVTAADLLNALGKRELRFMFSEYGDVRYALRLAEDIVDYRKENVISTTKDFNHIVEQTLAGESRQYKTQQELQRLYQALRIAVNLEYANLKEFLQNAYRALSPTGTLAVLTFHSGEERVVVAFIKSNLNSTTAYTSSKSSPQEVSLNPRARSATLYRISKS